MGFLDFLDNPGLMQNILGGSALGGSLLDGSSAQPPQPDVLPSEGPQQPVPLPPMDPRGRQPQPVNDLSFGNANPDPMYDPTSTGYGASLGPQQGGSPFSISSDPMNDPTSTGYGASLANAAPPAQPSAAAAEPNPTQPIQGNVPLPRPRPDMAQPGAQPGTAAPPLPPATTISARSATPMPPAGNMPPVAAAPMPPGNNGQGPTMSQSPNGGLAGAFGLNNPDRWRANMSGLGRGLSAVGQMRPGTPKGQAFAAGMGGALQGQTEMDQKQKDTLFNQSSTAFKDMLAARAADNGEEYKKAQGAYLQARARQLDAMTANGGKSSSAWQNTPYGKVIQVENEAQKYEKGQQILLQKRWQLNGTSPDEQQKDLDTLNKRVDEYRQRLYKSSGIDPQQATKLKDMGMSKDNPFDTKGMTLDQFHQMVPMGGWFKDQNGVIRQRTVPPPGAGGDQTPPAQRQPQADQPQQRSDLVTRDDDQSAMTDAA